MIRDGFHAALKRKIEEQISYRRDQICSGAAGSFEDYRNRVGYLQAMNDIIEHCIDVESKLYNDNPLTGET